MAEGARPELGRAVHPADDTSRRELAGDEIEQRRLVELLDALSILTRRAGELLRVDARSPERVIGHLAIGVAEIDAVRIERGAKRAAGIARRRRHEHAIESGLREDSRVGDAVQRNAAAETQVAQAGLALQRARHVDQRVLEHTLDAGGAISKAPAFGRLEIDRVVRASWWSEQIDELR